MIVAVGFIGRACGKIGMKWQRPDYQNKSLRGGRPLVDNVKQ